MDRKEANKAASNSRQFNKSVYELQDAMNKNQSKAEVKKNLGQQSQIDGCVY